MLGWDATGNASMFQAAVEVVPEPGSLFAMTMVAMTLRGRQRR
jgi:hypothetical protein